MEFNALAALCQSVVHDMKQSYPAWDLVAQRALKLSQQLRNTVQCMTAFCDAVQSVSDHASNLKGAARDVGACVTRVCMRQRALESRFRTMADAFSEELARGLQERSSYWKQRTGELDKAAAKHIKKVRARKRRPDIPTLGEQRQLCSQILGEQRAQFSFFISMLMPVLKAQIGVLDEGSHIRQAVDVLDDTVKCVDSNQLIETIVADASQGVDGAWRQCLDSATLRFREKSNHPNDYDLTPMARPHSLPVERDILPQDGELILTSKPPRRPSGRSSTKSCISPPPDSESIYTLAHIPPGRLMRPQSLTGEPRLQQGISTSGVLSTAPSSCCSSEASAAIISETLQQIDQLGSDLENYCMSTFDVRFGETSSQASSSVNGMGNGTGTVRMRSESSRPPPPARRNSTITAATPTAPSIVDARHNYMMGSRQSLNSSSLFSGSTSDLRHANVNPYARHSSLQPTNFPL